MRRHRVDKAIALITILLMLAGVVIVYAIGGRVAQAENAATGKNYSDTYFFMHHIVVVGAAIAAMFVGYKLSFDFLERNAKKLFWFSIVLCLLVTILGKMEVGLVTCDEGACRSFHVPIINIGFAPVELLKISVALYGAYLIKTRRASKELDTAEFWVPYGTMFGLTALLVGVFQKDFGSTVVIAAMMLAMALVGGVKLRYIAAAGAIILAIAGLLVITSQHRLERLANWDGSGDSYHKESSLMSLGTGGAMGVGLGNSIQASGYLPESLTDSIFSIIGETWGFVGTTMILLAFWALLAKILRVAKYTDGTDRSLFAAAIFAWLFGHVIINIGGMIGIIPMKGITLPFLSYGGTSMIFAAFVVGIVLKISGWTKRENINEDSSSRRGQRRACYTSSSRRS